MAATKDIVIRQGHTYKTVLRWEAPPIVRVPIVAITCPTGAARLNAPAHGILNGWRCAVTNVKGMTEINVSDPNKIRDAEYRQATVIDADTIELNEVNAAGFRPYVSGGFLQYNTPVVLAGVAARVRLWTKQGGVLLASSEASDDPLDVLTLTIDAINRTLTIFFSVEATELLGGKAGWYDVEAVTGGTVSSVPSAAITFDNSEPYNAAEFYYNGASVSGGGSVVTGGEVTGLLSGTVKVEKE